MTIVINDADNQSGSSFYTRVFQNREEFLAVYPGELPFPVNDEEPEKYPVLTMETCVVESFSGRESQHFIFFYDFDEKR